VRHEVEIAALAVRTARRHTGKAKTLPITWDQALQ
jgi:hypothetical protein